MARRWPRVSASASVTASTTQSSQISGRQRRARLDRTHLVSMHPNRCACRVFSVAIGRSLPRRHQEVLDARRGRGPGDEGLGRDDVGRAVGQDDQRGQVVQQAPQPRVSTILPGGLCGRSSPPPSRRSRRTSPTPGRRPGRRGSRPPPSPAPRPTGRHRGPAPGPVTESGPNPRFSRFPLRPDVRHRRLTGQRRLGHA